MRTTIFLITGALLLGACGSSEPVKVAPAKVRPGWSLDFADAEDVAEGDVPAWGDKRGYDRILGNPIYFFLKDGGLHLVAKPGPIHEKRILLAITDREKLKKGLESKVVLRLTPPDFGLDATEHPRIRIRMAPVTLPGKGADLRDSDKNDACFYLMLGFGEPRHDFSGIEFPNTLAYVWANRKWDDPFASDPEYREFLRYVAIGHGDADPGKIREITRDAAADYRKSYGVGEDESIPLIRSIALMVDANTVGTKSESVLESIRFLPPGESKSD